MQSSKRGRDSRSRSPSLARKKSQDARSRNKNEDIKLTEKAHIKDAKVVRKERDDSRDRSDKRRNRSRSHSRDKKTFGRDRDDKHVDKRDEKRDTKHFSNRENRDKSSEVDRKRSHSNDSDASSGNDNDSSLLKTDRKERAGGPRMGKYGEPIEPRISSTSRIYKDNSSLRNDQHRPFGTDRGIRRSDGDSDANVGGVGAISGFSQSGGFQGRGGRGYMGPGRGRGSDVGGPGGPGRGWNDFGRGGRGGPRPPFNPRPRQDGFGDKDQSRGENFKNSPGGPPGQFFPPQFHHHGGMGPMGIPPFGLGPMGMAGPGGQPPFGRFHPSHGYIPPHAISGGMAPGMFPRPPPPPPPGAPPRQRGASVTENPPLADTTISVVEDTDIATKDTTPNSEVAEEAEQLLEEQGGSTPHSDESAPSIYNFLNLTAIDDDDDDDYGIGTTAKPREWALEGADILVSRRLAGPELYAQVLSFRASFKANVGAGGTASDLDRISPTSNKPDEAINTGYTAASAEYDMSLCLTSDGAFDPLAALLAGNGLSAHGAADAGGDDYMSALDAVFASVKSESGSGANGSAAGDIDINQFFSSSLPVLRGVTDSGGVDGGGKNDSGGQAPEAVAGWDAWFQSSSTSTGLGGVAQALDGDAAETKPVSADAGRAGDDDYEPQIKLDSDSEEGDAMGDDGTGGEVGCEMETEYEGDNDLVRDDEEGDGHELYGDIDDADLANKNDDDDDGMDLYGDIGAGGETDDGTGDGGADGEADRDGMANSNSQLNADHDSCGSLSTADKHGEESLYSNEMETVDQFGTSSISTDNIPSAVELNSTAPMEGKDARRRRLLRELTIANYHEVQADAIKASQQGGRRPKPTLAYHLQDQSFGRLGLLSRSLRGQAFSASYLQILPDLKQLFA